MGFVKKGHMKEIEPKVGERNTGVERESHILGFGFWVLGFGFWILDFGFWVLGFGFWIRFGFYQAATTSQFFISYTIRTFGALVFATIMTTRQVGIEEKR